METPTRQRKIIGKIIASIISTGNCNFYRFYLPILIKVKNLDFTSAPTFFSAFGSPEKVKLNNKNI